MSNLLYEARLCPINKFIKSFGVGAGEIWERFEPTTFVVEAKDPHNIIV